MLDRWLASLTDATGGCQVRPVRGSGQGAALLNMEREQSVLGGVTFEPEQGKK